MFSIVCELLWIFYILKDLQVPAHLPMALKYDIKTALSIVANLIFYHRTKYIDINFHIVCE